MTGAAHIRVAIVQLNPTVGDIAGNASLMAAHYRQAASQGANLVVFPEMALTGYPPEDLVLMPDFRRQAAQQAEALAQQAQQAAMLFGSVWEQDGKVHNAALFCDKGAIRHAYAKTMLPNQGIFDEKRLFDPGDGARAVEWNGIRLGILICEDVWHGRMTSGLQGEGGGSGACHQCLAL